MTWLQTLYEKLSLFVKKLSFFIKKLSFFINKTESATSVADDAGQGSKRTPIEFVRLVHLTDLHYGFRFNHDLWRHVNSIVPGLKPHVILVTGDLVNSPWAWRFGEVREMLNGLKNAAIGDDKQCTPRLYVIPGNHDTR